MRESEGVILTGQEVNFDNDDAITMRFVADYEAKYDRNPSAYNANYYNATLLYAVLVQLNEADGNPVTRASLLDKRLETDSFDLVGGTVAFYENGTLLFPIQIKQITNSMVAPITSVTFH